MCPATCCARCGHPDEAHEFQALSLPGQVVAGRDSGQLCNVVATGSWISQPKPGHRDKRVTITELGCGDHVASGESYQMGTRQLGFVRGVWEFKGTAAATVDALGKPRAPTWRLPSVDTAWPGTKFASVCWGRLAQLGVVRILKLAAIPDSRAQAAVLQSD
jgi:hypothetical protein